MPTIRWPSFRASSYPVETLPHVTREGKKNQLERSFSRCTAQVIRVDDLELHASALRIAALNKRRDYGALADVARMQQRVALAESDEAIVP